MIEQYLEKLVSFYPVSASQENVKQLLDFVAEELEGFGLQVTRLEYSGVHSLYAHPKGSKHSKLLLQGHVDVVPGLEQPFVNKDDRYYGRGTYDMLFATACYLAMYTEHASQLSGLDVGLFLNGDEEVGGFNSAEKFLEEGYTADVVIMPDAGRHWGDLNVAAKGIYGLSLQINGRAHHGSRPWEGDGANIKLAHFLTEVEAIFDVSSQDNSTMTVAIIAGGDADNRGPATATCALDIRYKDKADLRRIKSEIRKLLDKYNGEIVEETVGDDYQLDVSNPLVQKFVKIYRKYAPTVAFNKAHGSSDARFFSAKGMPVIMLRPDGGGAHGDSEWIDIKTLNNFYELLTEYTLQTDVVE